MKGVKEAIALGMSMFMLSGCVTITATTNPYSDKWFKRYIPMPHLVRRTIFGSLKKELEEKRKGYVVLTMHPENLNDLKMYKLDLDREVKKKGLDELVFDTYNNVVLGVSKNEIVKIIRIKEKGYKKHPSPPFMEEGGKFSDTKRPYPKIITKAKYVGHILSLDAIGENDGIFDPKQKKQELFNHFEWYEHVWMGYGAMLFSTKQGKLGPVLHEEGGETTVGSTKGCIALDREGMKYFLEYTMPGATVRFIYDPVVEWISNHGEVETIKLDLREGFRVFRDFEEYKRQNEAVDFKNIPYFQKQIKK